MPLESFGEWEAMPEDRGIETQGPDNTFWDKIAAAVQTDNWTVNLWQNFNKPYLGEGDRNFVPWENLGPEWDDDRHQFVSAINPAEVDYIKNTLTREKEARRVLSQGGLEDMAAVAIGASIDPLMLAQLAMPATAWWGLATKLRAPLAVRGLATAGVAAVDVSLMEVALQASQSYRTSEESKQAILGAAIFSMFLPAGASKGLLKGASSGRATTPSRWTRFDPNSGSKLASTKTDLRGKVTEDVTVPRTHESDPYLDGRVEMDPDDVAHDVGLYPDDPSGAHARALDEDPEYQARRAAHADRGEDFKGLRSDEIVDPDDLYRREALDAALKDGQVEPYAWVRKAGKLAQKVYERTGMQARRLLGVQEDVESAFGAQYLFAKLSPVMDVMVFSDAVSAKRLMHLMARVPVRLKKNVFWKETPISVEESIDAMGLFRGRAKNASEHFFWGYRQRIMESGPGTEFMEPQRLGWLRLQRRRMSLARLRAQAALEDFGQARTGKASDIEINEKLEMDFEQPSGMLSEGEFMDLVYQAALRKEISQEFADVVPEEVIDLAAYLRKEYFEPMKERGVKLGLFPEDVFEGQVNQYVPIMFDRDAINAHYNEALEVFTQQIHNTHVRYMDKAEEIVPHPFYPGRTVELPENETIGKIIFPDRGSGRRSPSENRVMPAFVSASEALRKRTEGAPDPEKVVKERAAQKAAELAETERLTQRQGARATPQPNEPPTPEFPEGVVPSPRHHEDFLGGRQLDPTERAEMWADMKQEPIWIANVPEWEPKHAGKQPGRIRGDNPAMITRSEMEKVSKARARQAKAIAESRGLAPKMRRAQPSKTGAPMPPVGKVIGSTAPDAGVPSSGTYRLSEPDSREMATDILDRILNRTSLSRDDTHLLHKELKGHGMERVLNIDQTQDEWKPFLIQDMGTLIDTYHRSVVPDMALIERFGTHEIHPFLTKIREEYRDKMEVLEEMNPKMVGEEVSDYRNRMGKIRQNMASRMEKDVEKITSSWEILRNNYEPSFKQQGWHRTSRAARNLAVMAHGGAFVLSATVDLARIPMTLGFARAFKTGVDVMVNNRDVWKQMADDAAYGRYAVEYLEAGRSRSLADVGNQWGNMNRLERIISGGADNMYQFNLLTPWNHKLKQWTSVTASMKMLDLVDDVYAGRAIKQKDKEWMAWAGIDEHTAANMSEQWILAGEPKATEGMKLARTMSWDDQALAHKFELAMQRIADDTIITPGRLERPLVSNTWYGAMAFQYKSFALSATNRMMVSGLQKRDLDTMMGMGMAVGLGMGAYALKEVMAGREPSDNPMEWVYQGLELSGGFGIMGNIFDMTEMLPGGGFSVRDAIGADPRPAWMNKFGPGVFLGPSGDLMHDAMQVLVDSGQGDINDQTISAFNRIRPYRNLFYITALMNQMRDDDRGHSVF